MYNPRAVAGTIATLAAREAINTVKNSVIRPKIREYIKGRPRKYILRSDRMPRRSYLRRPYRKRRRTRSKRSKARRFKRSNVGRVGFNIGSSLSRRVEVNSQTFGALNSRELEIRNISNIPFANNSLIHARDRGMVNCSGWKFHVNIETKDVLDRTSIFNWAIVVPKVDLQPEEANFFRDPGDSGSGTRNKDFATTLTGIEMCYGQINTDIYYIIKHKRIKFISSVNTNQNEQYGSNHRELAFYVPFNRQLRFDEGEVTVKCTTPVYFVYWMDMPTNAAGGGIPNAYNIGHRVVCFFRNCQE